MMGGKQVDNNRQLLGRNHVERGKRLDSPVTAQENPCLEALKLGGPVLLLPNMVGRQDPPTSCRQDDLEKVGAGSEDVRSVSSQGLALLSGSLQVRRQNYSLGEAFTCPGKFLLQLPATSEGVRWNG